MDWIEEKKKELTEFEKKEDSANSEDASDLVDDCLGFQPESRTSHMNDITVENKC